MQVPQEFAAKAIRIFGQKGRDWVEALPSLLDLAVTCWQLTDCRVVQPLSVNLVCFAQSPIYGDVVLKLGVPETEIVSEMRALDLFGHQAAVRLHAADPEKGMMLLERIRPGTDLTAVKSTRERTQIAASLMAALHRPVPEEHGLPLYGDRLKKAFDRAHRNRWDCLPLVVEAEAAYRSLDSLNLPSLVLHGDLHHWNILRAGDGEWKVIDPHGVVGPAAFGPARFMQNELTLAPERTWPETLSDMTVTFARVLGEAPETVAAAAFVDMVLSLCWSYEDHATPEQIHSATRRAEAFLANCR